MNRVYEQRAASYLVATWANRLPELSSEHGSHLIVSDAVNRPLLFGLGGDKMQSSLRPNHKILHFKKQSSSEKDYRYIIKTNSNENEL